MKKRALEVDWTYLEARMEHLLTTTLTRDHIDDLIAKHAGDAIEDAIANEIRIFYTQGKGREIIKAEVIKRLSDHGESTL